MAMDNITYINAGAGSGKTYTLTHHLSKALVEDGIKPSEIILTTFTDAAASEFREKARAVLLKEGKTELSAEMGSAAIGTVHSVCQSFVRKFWYDLGLSPEMDVMSDDDRKFYISQSIADVVSEEDLNFFEEFARDFEVSRYEDNAIIIDFDFWKRYIEQVISAMAAYDVKDLKESAERSKGIVSELFYSEEPDCNILNELKTTFSAWAPTNRGNEDLVLRMKREGHQVGNHTWGHVKLSGTDTDGLLWEIQETDQLIGEVLGGSGYWVRPPYGLIDSQLQTMVTVPLVKWSVDPRDWENRNREKTVQAVLSAVQPNSIVLLHDIYESSVDAALDIVDKLEEEGYLFVTVEELLRLNGIEPQVGVFYSSGNA